MRNFDNERNSQTIVDENNSVLEQSSTNELQSFSEQYLSRETYGDKESDETNQKQTNNNSKPKTKNSQSPSIKQLTQYLASVTVVLTATVTVVAPAISALTVPPVEIVSQAVGALTYNCAVGFKGEEIELDALLLTSEGEQVTRYDDIKISAEIQADLNFSNLYPETEYELNMVDNEGGVRLEQSFTTQPFVGFEEIDGNKIKLNFHADLQGFEELGIELLTENGNDFSSNIVYEDNGDKCIYKKGLYASNYTLRARCFVEEGFYEFNSSLAIGELSELKYEAYIESFGNEMDIKHQIELAYKSGELFEYSISEVTIYSDDYEVYHSFYGEELALDGNNIYLTVYELIASGEYNVCIWGNFSDGEMNFYNQIWLGKLVI